MISDSLLFCLTALSIFCQSKITIFERIEGVVLIFVNHFSCTLSLLFSFPLVSGLSWLLLQILLPVVRDCQIKPVKRNQVTVYFYKYRLCIINSGFTSMQITSSYDYDYMHFLSNMAYISQIIFNLSLRCYSEYLTRSYKVCHQILVNRLMKTE